MKFLEPTTVAGQELYSLLQKWTLQSAEASWNDLERIFLACSSKIKNDEIFISGLYGQKALKERPHYYVSAYCIFVIRSLISFVVFHSVEVFRNFNNFNIAGLDLTLISDHKILEQGFGLARCY